MESTWLTDCVSKFIGYRDYDYGDIKIFISNTDTVFEAGYHNHQEYEFMSVKDKDLMTSCNGKNLVIKKGYIMPFNSLEIHGQPKTDTVGYFVCMIISDTFIKKVAYEAFNVSEIPVFNNKSFLPSPSLNYYLGKLIDEYEGKESANIYCKDLLKKLVAIEIFKCSENNVLLKDKKSNCQIQRAKKYLDENYQHPFDLEKVSFISGMNKYHFLKSFKEELHITPLQYILQLKIEKSKELISLGEKSLTEVAYEMGFSSQSHFINQFKKATGITPGQYKKTIL